MPLPFHSYLFLLPVVFLAGFVDSIAGGGGLLSLPAYMAAGLPPHNALANNKFSSVFGTTITTIRYSHSKMIDFKIAIPGAIFALIGSALGSRTVLLIDPAFLNYVLLFLIPAITIFTLVNKNIGKVKKEHTFSSMALYLIASLTGLIIGFYDGFFGPGTGSFLMFLYMALYGSDYVAANANAKVVNLASNVAAAAIFLISGKVIIAIGIPAAICGIAGNWLGSKIVIRNGAKVIRPFFLIVLALLFVRIIYNLLTNGQ
jgi:uncharacterized membrane protein YfcA